MPCCERYHTAHDNRYLTRDATGSARSRGWARSGLCRAARSWADVAGSSRCFMSYGIETVTSSATSGTIQRCGPMRHHMHATRALRWARDAEACFHDVTGVGWCKQHGRLMLERTFASTNGNEWTCAPGPTTISSSYSGHPCVLRSCRFPAPPAAKERRSTGTCLTHPLHTLTLAPRTDARSRHISSGYGPARCTCGRGEPSPGADVAGASPVPVRMWQRWAQSRCNCGRGEPSAGADVAAARPAPVEGSQSGLAEPAGPESHLSLSMMMSMLWSDDALLPARA